jgi:predicted transcriptional regulator
MAADLLMRLQLDCMGIWHFGEVLSDTLVECNLTQTNFAKAAHYSDAVVSRLINGQKIPRWMTFGELKRLIIAIGCDERQVGMLVTAFICDSLRERGAIQ